MDEYISKHDVLVALMDNDLDHIQAPNGKEAVQIFSELPPADVVQVVHAHWKDNKNGTVSCSRCSTWFQKERVPYLRFCGYCGARMDGKGEE